MINDSHTVILPYKTHWVEDYISEKAELLSLLGDKILNIEHIGSTSVEGMESKPIVDIVAVVEKFESVEKFSDELKKLGYIFYSSSTERHFYRKGNPVKYHLSITFADRGGFWVRQILFRNYLRNHRDLKKEYENMKKSLLKNDPTGVNSYFKGKDDFVKKILKLANWKGNQSYSEYISEKINTNGN